MSDFVARTKAHVNKFHEVALAHGGSNNGEPGPRPDYGPEYYGAFVFDLDGNKLEATLTPQPKKAPKAKKAKAATAKKSVKKSAKKSAKKAQKKAAPKKKAKRKAKKR